MSSSPFEQLFDISPFPAVITRLRDNSVIAINKRNSETFGISHADAVGQTTTDYYVDVSHRERLRGPLEATGRADDVLLHLKKPNGGTFWAKASARLITWDNEPAVLTVFEDISDQLTAQRALEASEHRLAAQSAALTAFTASHADPNDTFEHRLRRILEMAATTLEVERVSLWRFASHNAAIECVGLYRNSAKVHESGAVLAREAAPAYFDAIERQRVIAAPDARTDPRTSGFRVSYLEPLNIFAMLDVPLRRGQEVIGVLCAEHVGAARMWTVDEQNFAISTANLIAVAIADERRREALSQLDRELAGAARMQRQLLPPEMPHHPAIRFGSYYRTSRHAGGDYYDVLSLSGGRMGILVADVSGHGAPAAIVMAMIRAVVHTYPGVPDDPPAVLRYINTHFQFLWETSMYATAVYAVLDPSRKTLRMSSAGHPLPMKARRGGVDSPSIDTAMCLLWNVLGDIPCVEFPLEPGDRWAFFTDGITERQAPDGTMFDPERLSAALARHGAGAPAAIVDAIIGELDQFSAGHEPEDDQTLLVVGFD